MDDLELVDCLYDAFADSLPGRLATDARRLAFTLRLSPSADVPWSKVFGHHVTLAAPALFAEAMPQVPDSIVRDAIAAQTFAAIEAFGTDRIEDRQIEPTPEVRAVLEHIRNARDAARQRTAAVMEDPRADFSVAWPATMAAIAAERAILLRGDHVDFEDYERTSLGKQSVGFPPSLALAHAAGWDAAKKETVATMLASIWLALQLHDDAVDWEDDFLRGGAWAVVVAIGKGERARGGAPPSAELRRKVFDSGVLARMLDRTREHYGIVRKLGRELGTTRLADWATDREEVLTALAACETKNPGYAGRAHALIAWAGEVLG